LKREFGGYDYAGPVVIRIKEISDRYFEVGFEQLKLDADFSECFNGLLIEPHDGLVGVPA
jgi:hypothetical protein